MLKSKNCNTLQKPEAILSKIKQKKLFSMMMILLAEGKKISKISSRNDVNNNLEEYIENKQNLDLAIIGPEIPEDEFERI